MASYQDIDTRLAVLEDMLRFVMTNARMTAAVTSGLTDASGRPLPTRKFEGSLLDFYMMAKQENLPVVTETEAEAPPTLDEIVN